MIARLTPDDRVKGNSSEIAGQTIVLQNLQQIASDANCGGVRLKTGQIGVYEITIWNYQISPPISFTCDLVDAMNTNTLRSLYNNASQLAKEGVSHKDGFLVEV